MPDEKKCVVGRKNSGCDVICGPDEKLCEAGNLFCS